MRIFLARRIRTLLAFVVAICTLEIGASAITMARRFKDSFRKDGPTHLISIFQPFRIPIPYHAKFNVLLDEGTDIAVKRLAQFALAPRQLREGGEKKWLVYYSAKGRPLPEGFAKTHELVLVSQDGASLYRRKD